MDVKIKRLSETATMPAYAHENDAGMDLYADLHPLQEDIEAEVESYCLINPHSTTMISCGFAMAIPEGYFGGIYARSGLASKQNLRPANCVGVVDSSYRGEVMVALHNDSEEIQEIKHGQRIAQMLIQPVVSVTLEQVEELDETERGKGGFGSSGK